MSLAIDVRFGGAELVLDARGALYWPKEKLLAVSDLHFEKASFLAQHGSPIAPYDTLDTLERLNALLVHYQPHELLLLGDSFHDRQAWARLDGVLREKIKAIMAQVKTCRWIEGNHDTSLSGAGLLAFERKHERHGIVFSHDHEPHPLPQIIGHYHPKTSISFKGQKLRGRCFVYSDTLLVMPAFGSYTGGLKVNDPVFSGLFQHANSMQIYLMYQQRLYSVRP